LVLSKGLPSVPCSGYRRLTTNTKYSPLTRYSSLATKYSSLITKYSLLTTKYSSLVTKYSPLTRYSSLVTKYSLLTTKYSSLTTQQQPLAIIIYNQQNGYMSLIASGAVTIAAPPAQVWDYLVNPEHTRKYMFGCAPVTDWQLGSPLLWQGVWEGVEAVFVKGQLVGFEPDGLLAFTTIDPNSTTVADLPENYTTVTYRLEAEGEGTRLTVTQGDFATVAEGEKRYAEVSAGGGWQTLLETIQQLVETGG
jgi:uncharacterized protein YndB with AHSA1/START domain